MADTITLEVTRYRPEQDAEPTLQSYEVPLHRDWVVLDALNYIKDKLDGSLSYRWSCRMGVCGSCGLMVNGTPRASHNFGSNLTDGQVGLGTWNANARFDNLSVADGTSSITAAIGVDSSVQRSDSTIDAEMAQAAAAYWSFIESDANAPSNRRGDLTAATWWSLRNDDAVIDALHYEVA